MSRIKGVLLSVQKKTQMCFYQKINVFKNAGGTFAGFLLSLPHNPVALTVDLQSCFPGCGSQPPDLYNDG